MTILVPILTLTNSTFTGNEALGSGPGGNPKPSLGGPRTAREVAGRPLDGAEPSQHQPCAHREPRLVLVAQHPLAPLPPLSQRLHRRHSLCCRRLQKHEARRSLDSPGFAWEFSSMMEALSRGSPGEGATHDVQALGLRMAGPGRPKRLGRSVNEGGLHVSRKSPGDS